MNNKKEIKELLERVDALEKEIEKLNAQLKKETDIEKIRSIVEIVSIISTVILGIIGAIVSLM